MTERGGTIIFCRILAPPMQCPPTLPRRHNTYLSYDREGAPLSLVGFWRPPMPPSPDVTILNYLNDREKGLHYVCKISALPMPPPPSNDAQYLTILMTERGGLIIFCRILAPPPPPIIYEL